MTKPESSIPLEEQSSNPANSAVHSVTESGPDEINRLRDILFGSQTRSLDKRLGDLETRLETVRQETANLFTEKIDRLANSTSAQFAETRREFNSKFTSQAEEQSAQLRAVQKESSDSVEKLAADLLRQIRDVQKELSDRLDRINTDQTERMRAPAIRNPSA